MDALRVAQLNTGSMIEPGWRERRYEVLAWLDRLDADVVCLQEIWTSGGWPSTAAWLAEHHTGAQWTVAFDGVPAPAGFGLDTSLRWGCAIMSRLAVQRHETVTLPGATDNADNPWDQTAMTAVIASIGDATVISAHLSPMDFRADIRAEQVRFVHERALAWHRGSQPIVWCGDLNAEPDASEIASLTSLPDIAWVDAWTECHPGDPGHTQHPRNPMHSGDAKRIDYVLVGTTAGPSPILACDLAFHEPLTGCYASDHFGLIASIQRSR